METCREAAIVIAKRSLIASQVSLIVLLWACGTHRHAGVGERPIGRVIKIDAPLGLPPVPMPANNPETAESVALGRRLFYERKLSANGSLLCASCHNPGRAFSDGRRNSVGFGGKNGTRNAPTVINAAYAP